MSDTEAAPEPAKAKRTMTPEARERMPAALLVLLATAARAGRVRLGLLVRRWPGQGLGRVVADELFDPHQGLGREVVSLRRRQFVEPPGLLVVLGDAYSFFVTHVKG